MSFAARARAHLVRSGLPLVLGLATALAVMGCPRQPDAPDPGMGTPCEQDDLSDCNETDCGLLRLCVDGFCEDEPSLVRPCPGEGTPIPPEP